MRYIALDTETTGLKVEAGNKLIEIGCLEIIDRTLTGKEFHKYINPEREIEESATRVHGMKWSDLEKYPVFNDVAQEFCDFIKGSVLIIHNAKFDLGFLNSELTCCELPNVESCTKGVIDSLSLARRVHPGKKNSLDALCSRYSVDNSIRTLHGALLDSSLLAKVYLAMTRGQEKLDIQNRSNKSVCSQKKQSSDKKEILVNKASTLENEAHKLYLLRMKKDCEDKVLWDTS